ncbi:hypothetical protein [Ruminococcus sp.]
MINVDYKKLSQLGDSFAVYSERIYEQCEKIKQAQMQLSQFSDFDDEIFQLKRLMKHLEEIRVKDIMIKRAVALCAESIEECENKALSLAEMPLRQTNTNAVGTVALNESEDDLTII